jgi:hypothetical protein
MSAISAVASGILLNVLYTVSQGAIPLLSGLGIGMSLLIAYPAFLKR